MLHKNSRNMILLVIIVLCAVGFLVAGDHEDMHSLKLEDLADGETRTFGEGDHKVTVTRTGDQLTVKIDGMEGLHGQHMLWVGEDGKVITLNGGGAHGKMMFIGGEGDAEGHMIIKKTGDGTEIEKEVHVIRIGDEGEDNITIDIIGGKAEHGHGDKIVLRCPEGDTTMVIDSADAEEVFLCPKHKIEMKPAVHKLVEKKVEVHSESSDQKHE